MKHIVTYLHFDGACRPAMTFYQQCLGGELQVTSSPAAGERVMHAQLIRDGRPLLMACDTPNGEAVTGRNCSVVVECDSQEELERLYAAFSEGGEGTLPLTDMPQGKRFGMLTDRFGVYWMFHWEPSK